MKRTVFLIVFLVAITVGYAQEVLLTVTQIRSANGKITIQIFKDNESFVNEKPFKEIRFDKKGLVNGTIELSLSIEPGTYGFAMLDDENDNGKADRNWIKMPTEGFGFSNYYLTKLSRPHLDEFKVVIKQGKNRVGIKTKYM